MTRITNLAQHQISLSNIMAAQKRIFDTQVQASSGKKSTQYTGIADATGRLLKVEMAHTRTQQFIKNNNLIEQRLQVMESSVSQVFDIMSDFKRLMINALNANNAADLGIADQAQAMLNQLTALLNVQDDGRYLFAGSRTNTAPVSQSGLPVSYTIPTSDGDSSGYYNGNTVQFSVRADENFDVSYGQRASEVGFERAIRALDIIIKGSTNRATIEDALAVSNRAIDGVTEIRTRIGGDRSTLAGVNQRHEEFLLFSEKTISDIENVDIAEIITRMNADQVAVEASFMSIARLSQLNLIRFLR